MVGKVGAALLGVALLLGGAAAAAGGEGDLGAPPRASPGELFACEVDLAEVGVEEPLVRALAQTRFELRKKMIRMEADREVARLELQRLVRDRAFDLTAAQKVAGGISVIESKIRAAAVEYLHELAHVLSDPQWDAFLTRCDAPAPP